MACEFRDWFPNAAGDGMLLVTAQKGSAIKLVWRMVGQSSIDSLLQDLSEPLLCLLKFGAPRKSSRMESTDHETLFPKVPC